ncbi:thioredoxin family protein [Geodermatophilus ruber]|uniref:Thiol-disulfide isomerase or thioredoxin n=1 Tax=Geodermatophilus ruber TaxID=504800 RepID=A0A1I4CGK1_9ACTN|nr:thioredoxin family protein [Geodermatophilus ruber]SFK79091.1 Thiol-disulfide isomerase or thioredoxin [Geodermatophilus ruber]
MAGPGQTLRAEGRMPALDGATGWLNTEPLTPEGLRGRVVLVDFWTYTCINWLRTLPHVRAWAGRYRDQGLVVLGVHTPEFSFEQDAGNVRRAVERSGITYPVALDSDYAIWRAFANRYWPALYFVDATGRVRHHWFGEGDFERSEQVIRQLLAESGADPVGPPLGPVAGDGVEAAADWGSLESGETYLGYERTGGFASPEGPVPDESRSYSLPARLRPDHWALAGTWTVGSEAAVLDEAGGVISCRFHARDLHLVMGPGARGAPVPFRVLLDGRPPGGAHGADVDERGGGVLSEPRLHQLIRQPPSVADRQFEIEFAAPGAEALVFTFG